MRLSDHKAEPKECVSSKIVYSQVRFQLEMQMRGLVNSVCACGVCVHRHVSHPELGNTTSRTKLKIKSPVQRGKENPFELYFDLQKRSNTVSPT